ncbi:MAG: hypothetical protein ACK5QR_02165 [bacterium]
MNRWRGCACVLVLCALLGGLLAGCRGEIPAGGQGAGGLRVAALAPGLSAMVREMGLGDRIVARHAFDVWSDAHLPAVGDQSGINYEALIASAPTHVLLQAGAGGVPERLTALASARGWRVLAVPMLTLEEVEEADGRVRAFLGVPVGAGGFFTTAGGVSANRIARYNPSTGVWSALGSGTNDGVFTLAVLPGGDVIAGGSFTTAGGVSANRIARYNPSTGVWSALGSGISFQVNALAVLPGEDVLAGGSFITVGGVPANNIIARYNPSTGVWSALGAGIDNAVETLAVLPGGDVLVGGLFTAAGGVPANNIARYFLGGPSPSILWQPVAVVTSPSGPALFTVAPAANGGSGVFTYQWQKDGVAISTSTNPTANAPTLLLSSVQAGDLGSYSCIVTSNCGSALSNPAVLSFARPTCGPSDVAGPGQSVGSDGQLTADDIIVFLNRFFAGC